MHGYIDGSSFQQVSVVQMATTTKASARLRHIQPEVDYDKSYEALKQPKKTVDIQVITFIHFFHLLLCIRFDGEIINFFDP